MLKKILRKLHIIHNIYVKHKFFFKKKSYAMDNEDTAVLNYFKDKKNGFYIDVGAHHPMRFSNTYLFYKKKWKGIYIDALPGSMKLFNKLRPRDINLELGVGQKEEELNYYMFNETALNSFSK